jgi:chloride channel protein, CIC family
MKSIKNNISIQNSSKFIQNIFVWILKRVNQKRLILVLSFITGLSGGLAAIVLKNIVHYTNMLLTGRFMFGDINFMFIIYPMIGIVLAVLFVNFLIKDYVGHGVSKILFAISKKNGNIKPHNNYSSIIASTFTVGFGGSVGLEAPIVLTGASFGSNIGRLFRLTYKQKVLLIGCGAAGALAGIFKAPIAAVVFCFEVLMLDLTLVSVAPLLIASVTGALATIFLMGEDVVFNYALEDNIYYQNIPYYLLLGVITGMISIYFTKGAMFFEKQIMAVKGTFKRLLVGGVILGSLIFLFPSLYGEGYDILKSLLQGNPGSLVDGSLFYDFNATGSLFLVYLGLIIVFKVMAMAITTGAGGVGGIFAPALFSGGVLGYLFAGVLSRFNVSNVSPQNYTLVGMAGMMAGVMQAPLTSIFLIAEITGGYNLFIPLIVTATVSYLTANHFIKNSIYTFHLAKRGDLITHDKDKAALTLMDVYKVIEKNFVALHPEDKLTQLVEAVKKSKRNVFPVVDNDGILVGILTLNDVKEMIFEKELYEKVRIKDIMYYPETYVNFEDTLQTITDQLEVSGHYNVPVIKDNKYIGFISRAKIFSVYRKLIKECS